MQEDPKTEEYVDLNGFGDRKEDWKEKFKDFIIGKYFILIAVILLSIIAYSLGRISTLQDKRPEIKVISESPGEVMGVSMPAATTPKTIITNQIEPSQNTAAASASANQDGPVVGSKNSTKYHYPWCPGAKQISPQNLITFNSIEEARAAGYTPAGNCKGLK
jgi:hypothetical protein